MREILSQRLRELREATGLSQKELSKKISVSAASIGYYENGDRIPGLDVAAELADFFGVSLDYLAGRSDARTPEAADITARTGLSEAAVEVLEFINDAQEYGYINGYYRIPVILNEMLETSISKKQKNEFFEWFEAKNLEENTLSHVRDFYDRYSNISARCISGTPLLEKIVELYGFPFNANQKIYAYPATGLSHATGGILDIISTRNPKYHQVQAALDEANKFFAENFSDVITYTLADIADDTAIRKITEALREICHTHRALLQELKQQEVKQEEQNAQEN